MFQIFFTIVSVLLVLVILLQQKSSSLGSMMGADSGDEMVQTRRGADRFLHLATIALALAFAGGGLAVLFGLRGIALGDIAQQPVYVEWFRRNLNPARIEL